MTEENPTNTATDVRVEVFGQTDVGCIRDHNEDTLIVADLTENSRLAEQKHHETGVGKRGMLIAVFDGMGGAAAGEVASDLAATTVYEKLIDGDIPEDHDALSRRLVRAIETAGLRIYSEAKLDRHHRGMGTTATVAALLDDYLFIGQVGDSRAYILRGDKLVQVTRDQSLVNQLIEAGQLTEEEAENFEHNNIILQALGTSDSVLVDLTWVHLRRGDKLMLCSDGLSGMLRFDDIRATLLEHNDIAKACTTLIEKANDAGGHDNVTVIVARFDGDGIAEAKDDDEALEYRKYTLPRSSRASLTTPGRRGALKPMNGKRLSARDAEKSRDDKSQSTESNKKTSNKKHGSDASQTNDDVDDTDDDTGEDENDDSDDDDGKNKHSGKDDDHGGDLDEEVMTLPLERTPLWVLAFFVVVIFCGLAYAAYRITQATMTQ